jgi:hypothetical protein
VPETGHQVDDQDQEEEQLEDSETDFELGFELGHADESVDPPYSDQFDQRNKVKRLVSAYHEPNYCIERHTGYEINEEASALDITDRDLPSILDLLSLMIEIRGSKREADINAKEAIDKSIQQQSRDHRTINSKRCIKGHSEGVVDDEDNYKNIPVEFERRGVADDSEVAAGGQA